MTKNEFIQHAVLYLLRSSATHEYAIAQAVALAQKLGDAVEWSDCYQESTYQEVCELRRTADAILERLR
jgi:hypothetical protein